MPDISVIVPVYKVESYLCRCVDSILAQTFTNFELILVDDGSPDNCGAICDEYATKDSRIHVIHQENGGLSAARNAGIDWAFAHSDSEWLTFIDSDDWVHEKYLELLYVAVKETRAGASTCRYRRVLPSGEYLDIFQESGKKQECSFEEYFCLTGPGLTTVIAWAKLYNKSAFQSVRFPVGKINEDLFTTHKVVYNCGSIVSVDYALYFYTQSEGSIMRSSWNSKRLDEVEASEQIIRFMRLKDYRNAEVRFLKRYHWVLTTQIKQIQEQDDQSLKKYEFRLYRKLQNLLIFHGKEMGYALRTHRWYYEQAFPKLSYLYWVCVGVIGKIKRMVK